MYGCWKALERINEIRKEAYDEGLTWTDGKKLGSEDHPYVALKWSKDLEKLCQIRAAEADFYMGHSRPGTSSDTWFSYNGIQSQNEILAWYSSVATGIEGWYSEKELYEKYLAGDTSITSHDYGHYTAMLSPNNKYVAVAGFKADNLTGPYSHTVSTAGEFYGSGTLNQTEIGLTGKYIQDVEILAKNISKLQIKGDTVMDIGDSLTDEVLADFSYTSNHGTNTIKGAKVHSSITWSSSDSSIVSVNSSTGEMAAKSSGVSKITATLSSGSVVKTADIDILVLPEGASFSGVENPKMIETDSGTSPDLPNYVTGVLNDGTKFNVPVTWNEYDANELDTDFNSYEFDISGTAVGLDVIQKVHVKPAPIYDISTSVDKITVDSGTKPAEVKVNLELKKKNYIITYPISSNWTQSITSRFTDGNVFTVSWDQDSVLQYKSRTGGEKTITGKLTFQYDGETVERDITQAIYVNPATVTNVEFKNGGATITTPSGTKPTYPTATVTWSNGDVTEEEIEWGNATPTTSDRKYMAREGGTYTLTGIYGGKTTSITVKVTPATATGAELDIDDLTQTVTCGTAPTLPTKAIVTWSNNDKTNETITWDAVSENSYNKLEGNNFTVNGTCMGYDVSTAVTVYPATIKTIGTLQAVTTSQKKAPQLPQTVAVTWSNGEVRQETIHWDTIQPSSYETPDTSFKANGYIEDFENKQYPVDVTVNVVSRSLTSVEWKFGNPTSVTSYYDYKKSDFAGTLIATYDNDDTEEVEVTSDMITGFDSASTDKTQTITITYIDKTITAEMNLVSRTGIEITTLPTKTEYIEGENLNIAGLVVKELLDDNTSRVISSDKYSVNNCSGFVSRPTSASEYGNQEITFSLYGFTDTFTVKVKEKTPTRVVINSAPTTTTYVEGQALSVAGLVVNLKYDNGDIEPLTIGVDDIMMDPDSNNQIGTLWNTNTVGKHTCYVWVPVSVVTDGNGTTTTSYIGATFEIEVIAKELTSLTWVSKPTKTTYPQNDKTYSETSFADGKVLATYNDGDTKELALTDEGVSVTGFDITKVGTQTVTVSYDGKGVTFDATVTEPKVIKTYVVAPTKTGYVQGENFEIDGAKIVFAKDNGYDETIDVTTNNSDIAITLGGSSNIMSPLTDGAKTLVISYKGTALKDIDGNDITINVAERTGISVKTNPATTTYVEGTALTDISLYGLQLEAEFEGGAKSLIPSKDVSLETNADFDSSKLGTQKIYVSAYGFETSFDVTIREKRLTGLTVETQPNKTTYAKGQAIDITGLVVKGTYDNGTTGYVDVTKDNLRIGSAANTFGSVANTKTVGALEPKVVVAVTGDDGTYYVASDVIQLTVEEKTVSSVSILTKPSKLTFTQNASDFNSYRFADGKLKASCNCGLEEEVSFNDPNVTITGFDISKAGNQTVTVSYGGKSATFVVTVTASNPNPGNNGSGNGGSGNGNNNNVPGGNGTGNGNGTGGNNGSGNSNSTGNNNGSGSSNSTGNNNGSGNSNGTGSDNGTGNNVDTPATPAPAAPTYSNEWVNGVWYDENGNNTYSGTLSWKSNSTGWWVEDSAGWYPVSCWQKIDGEWYYFNSSGYMASSEWYNGYWFNGNGTWDSTYKLTWRSNSTGWWIEDISGWWPSNCWQKIDGSWYYFDASGYMVTSRYIDGYWIGANGVCQ